MRVVKLLLVFSLSIAVLTGCNKTEELTQVADLNEQSPVEEAVYGDDEGVWARENFDLQAVGNILEESDDIQDFERRLNSNDGVNNLDLNGDNYADYISVREFDDRTDGNRGFSLFSQFDGNDIQEIASVIFDRDRPNRSGARVYLRGNEQIYGDSDNFYEGNWLDKSLNIAKYVFGDRNEPYRSQYNYDNYPDYYDPYNVVETPVYRSRITRYTVDPTFIQLREPRQFEIKSPYYDRSYDKVYVKLAKPSKQQVVFYKNRPNRRDFDDERKDRRDDRKERREDRREDRKDIRDDRKERREDSREYRKDVRDDKKERRKDRKERRKDRKSDGYERKADRRNNKPARVKIDREQNNKPAKAPKNKGGKGGKGDKGGKGKGKGKKH